MQDASERPEIDLTVFIMSYNRPIYLREMLLSVLAQTYLPAEIIICDNGSKKDTYEAIEDLIGGRVRWVGADYNHQSLWNFQRAYKMSEKKYFVILHDDDRILPEFLKRTFQVLESDDSIIAITTNGFRISDNGERRKDLLLPREVENIVYINNSGDAAYRYSYSFIPYPNVVYRNGFTHKVEHKVEFGKILDCIFLIDLASLGRIAILDELLFEYRLHKEQDSAVLPEQLLQRKEDYISSKVEGHVMKDVTIKNLERCQTNRFVNRIINTFIFRKFNPRQFFKDLNDLDYRYLSIKSLIYNLNKGQVTTLINFVRYQK